MTSKSNNLQIITLKLFLSNNLPYHIRMQIISDLSSTPVWFSPEFNIFWEENSVYQIACNGQVHTVLNLKTHVPGNINTVPILLVLNNKIANLQMKHGDQIQLLHLVQVALLVAECPTVAEGLSCLGAAPELDYSPASDLASKPSESFSFFQNVL
jgi:hypothetical protein